MLADGHRALVVSHADEERIVWLAEPLVALEDMDPEVARELEDTFADDQRPASCAPATRCWSIPKRGMPSSASQGGGRGPGS